MNPHLILAFVAIALPFAAAGYGHAPYGQGGYAGNGVEELINAATANQQAAAASLTATADVGASPAAQAGLAQANAQLQALNANPSYQNLKNSDTIAETLAENTLASNIRQGNINVVAPNVVGQTAFRSLLVPQGLNNHQVIATQPLQPIIVNQPGSPPAQISSGPPAVVRAAPVVYKLKPSIIYQQEVINKVPTPLSLNPVYVKVYKPGKQVDAPVSAPVYGQAASSFGGSSSAGASAGAGEVSYGGAQYASAAQYVAPQPAYGAQPAY
ncbi:chorion protein S36 [Lucilia cuprina]|uniref:chorion protein S36 n=1 Tax=Lucilia cuprina TaxID=7375 RepID=UPI001F057A94|nr:chorion protein S36 [Lucilia cuprina]